MSRPNFFIDRKYLGEKIDKRNFRKKSLLSALSKKPEKQEPSVQAAPRNCIGSCR
jgi:hypothetical protein